MAINQVFPSTWRGLLHVDWWWFTMAMFPADNRDQDEAFIWKQGKAMVTLTKAGESWQVAFLTQGRLLGPRMKVYEAVHRQAKFAAWDVMARVISVTHDEEVGLDVAVRAAQWMRRSGAVGG